MAFPRLRTAAHRRRRAASEAQHQRPRTAPALLSRPPAPLAAPPSPPPPPPPPCELDTSTLHSSLAPSALEPRHFSSTLLPPAASDGVREEGGGGGGGSGTATAGDFDPDATDATAVGTPGGGGGGGGGGESRDELIQHMRDQLRTANSVIRFLHEHVDGMREDRDRYRERVEELKSLARLTLDMLEGAHRRGWEVGREVRAVRERAVVVEVVEGEGEREDEGQPRARRRDSLMRRIGLGRRAEGREKERERGERKAKHDSGRGGDDRGAQGFGGESSTMPTVGPADGGPSGGRAGSSSGNARRKRGHIKSHSESLTRLREDGVLAIPAVELEKLVQVMDRNVNMLREDIKKLVDEVNTHKHNPVYTNLTDVPPRFG